MLQEKIQRDKILDLLADYEKTMRHIVCLWLSGFISDEKMFEFIKKLSTLYQQLDLTEKLPVIKYN